MNFLIGSKFRFRLLPYINFVYKSYEKIYLVYKGLLRSDSAGKKSDVSFWYHIGCDVMDQVETSSQGSS